MRIGLEAGWGFVLGELGVVEGHVEAPPFCETFWRCGCLLEEVLVPIWLHVVHVVKSIHGHVLGMPVFSTNLKVGLVCLEAEVLDWSPFIHLDPFRVGGSKVFLLSSASASNLSSFLFLLESSEGDLSLGCSALGGEGSLIWAI